MPKRRTSIVHTITDEALVDLANHYDSIRQIMIHLSVKSGSLFPELKRRLFKLGFEEKFKMSQRWNRGKTILSDSRIQSKISSEHFLTNNSRLSTSYVKKLLIHEFHFIEVCAKCGIDTWLNQKITLELDHINGNNRDNRINNLRFLCPNCHSQTPTWRGRNINGLQKVSDDVLTKALLESGRNVRKALIEVGLSPKGGNYARCYQLLSLLASYNGITPLL